jgi:hypothetical protein
VGKLDDVLAAAKAGAADQGAGTALVATSTGTGSNLPARTDMSTESFLNSGGMDVDGYVAVNEFGIRLNKNWKGFIDDFEATIDLSEVVYAFGVQKTVGKNVEYAKTYDGVTTATGGNWSEVCAQYKAESQKDASPYRLAEIPVTLTQGYADPKGGGDIEADTTLGITTSVTAFHKKLAKAGLGEATVKVKVKHAPRQNSGGVGYGVYEYELIEVVDAD